jgi:hypothetical protein
MEVLAAFLLLLIAIAAIVIGGVLWLIASSLRRRKLASGEDKIDRHMIGAEGVGAVGPEEEGADQGDRGARRSQPRPTAGRQMGRERARGRPEHHRVTNEQGTRSIPRR